MRILRELRRNFIYTSVDSAEANCPSESSAVRTATAERKTETLISADVAYHNRLVTISQLLFTITVIRTNGEVLSRMLRSKDPRLY